MTKCKRCKELELKIERLIDEGLKERKEYRTYQKNVISYLENRLFEKQKLIEELMKE